MSKDHPRARGRDRGRGGEGAAVGSPPRAGTRHTFVPIAPAIPRITPARGDETSCEGLSDYLPRAGTRHIFRCRNRQIMRITPACGEETSGAIAARSLDTDHPRARGRDGIEAAFGVGKIGSPPRAGTRRLRQDRSADGAGITPARGDETSRHHSGACCSADHPRARGRDRMIFQPGFDQAGSPPRAGTRRCADEAAGRVPRITPRAGTRLQRDHEPHQSARITPARGNETLAHKPLISHRTSFRCLATVKMDYGGWSRSIPKP